MRHGQEGTEAWSHRQLRGSLDGGAGRGLGVRLVGRHLVGFVARGATLQRAQPHHGALAGLELVRPLRVLMSGVAATVAAQPPAPDVALSAVSLSPPHTHPTNPGFGLTTPPPVFFARLVKPLPRAIAAQLLPMNRPVVSSRL